MGICSSKEQLPYRTRIHNYYAIHDPSKIADIPGILEKYKGREEEVMSALRAKYGPEPNPADPRLRQALQKAVVAPSPEAAKTKQARELNQTIDKIRSVFNSVGIGSEAQFPQIVVIGQQSSGKSTVINRLVGVPFLPTGNGTVTKCPLRISLHNRLPQDGNADFGHFSHLPGKNFTDFGKIAEEISKRSGELVGNSGKLICASEIELTLHIKDAAEVTVVDLPGTVSFDQGKNSVKTDAYELQKSYAIQENTIVLAVFPFSEDLQAQPVIGNAIEWGAMNRTIGVATRCDDMNDVTKIQDVLQYAPKAITMTLGIYAVATIAPPPGLTVDAAERQHFDKFVPKCTTTGIPRLAQYLQSVLMERIVDSLPAHQRKIKQLVDAKKREVIESKDAVKLLAVNLNRYASYFRMCLEGRAFKYEHRQPALVIRKITTEMKKRLMDKQPKHGEEEIRSILNQAGGAVGYLVDTAGVNVVYYNYARSQLRAIEPTLIEGVGDVVRALTAVATVSVTEIFGTDDDSLRTDVLDSTNVFVKELADDVRRNLKSEMRILYKGFNPSNDAVQQELKQHAAADGVALTRKALEIQLEQVSDYLSTFFSTTIIFGILDKLNSGLANNLVFASDQRNNERVANAKRVQELKQSQLKALEASLGEITAIIGPRASQQQVENDADDLNSSRPSGN